MQHIPTELVASVQGLSRSFPHTDCPQETKLDRVCRSSLHRKLKKEFIPGFSPGIPYKQITRVTSLSDAPERILGGFQTRLFQLSVQCYPGS